MTFIPRPSEPHPFPRKKEQKRINESDPLPHKTTPVNNPICVLEKNIALCLLLSLQLYVLSVIWHAFILKASLRC